MPGLGTIINVAAIILGGIIGALFGKFVPQRVRDTLMASNAVAVIILGIGGAISKMLVYADGAFDTQGTMMMIGSLAIGGIIGELINIEGGFERFGEWLKNKTGNAKDGQFVNAFVTASLTVCIGAMAIVGAIEDGINSNHSILFAKAILDLAIIMIMTASLGKGCIFSAIPVGILQGLITLLGVFLQPVMTAKVLDNISYVGSVMIFCVGINLLFEKKIKVANLLPSLVIASVWAFF